MKDLAKNVKNAAKLAMLKTENFEELAIKFNEFIKEADILNEIEADGFKEKGELKLRCDEVGECLIKAEVMQNAPEQKDGFFAVPKTVEG